MLRIGTSPVPLLPSAGLTLYLAQRFPCPSEDLGWIHPSLLVQGEGQPGEGAVRAAVEAPCLQGIPGLDEEVSDR